MFNNNIEYMEELITQTKDLGEILENRAEYFTVAAGPSVETCGMSFKQSRVDSLVWAYRDIGYLYAKLNPLGESYDRDYSRLVEFQEESYHRLDPAEFDLTAGDLDTEFFGGKAIGTLPLREMLGKLDRTYRSSVGVEFLHIQNRGIRAWLIDRMESSENETSFSITQKRIILEDLLRNDELENILHRTFIGQKRFSIQGSDTVIPALHYLADSAHRFGIEEIVMGTSHRGRLSILSLILHLSPEDIFYLFEENFVPGVIGGSGDVRYHIGYCTRHVNDDGTSVSITMLPNSSHVESVDAVVEGNARGLQDLRHDGSRTRVLPVILHGDASFAAQGVVAETFNLSRLKGYATGGTLHIIVNNQVGFTTSVAQGRSGLNPTDIARMLAVPIFHVNGDDAEAVLHVMQVALEFRQSFHRDVVVDIYCYRRHGHNEGDEPSFTQPHMYSLIKDHASAASLYLERCLEEGVVSREEADEMRRSYRDGLLAALGEERKNKAGARRPRETRAAREGDEAVTAVAEPVIVEVAKKITMVPAGFHIHERLKKIIENNYKKFIEGNQADWSMAEALAIGTLLLEGVPVRLSGQDSERGTFSQRHLVWWEEEKEDCCHYIPLAGLAPGQAGLSVFNSPLSEYSVLAFEYGYATARGDALVIWEAQFGDFVNGAQVVIDNYIIAGRSKWDVKNGLVLLLPHGFEGMGPEHSSAHLERFLQLSCQDNIRVCSVTTPAQYFHLLRRQKKAREQRPLVVMTPKSLLRHPRAVSPLEDFTGGRFRPVIEDANPGDARRVIFCSGKIYYDLIAGIDEKKSGAIGIVRVEELYPFPGEQLGNILGRYGKAKSFCWVQEEPKNRGAWHYMSERFGESFPGIRLTYIGREASASPATGSLKEHNEEQRAVIEKALNDTE